MEIFCNYTIVEKSVAQNKDILCHTGGTKLQWWVGESQTVNCRL